MAGREDSIAVRNVLEGTLSADNAMATSVGTAFDPAYALVDEAGAQIVLYINSSDYKMYAQLKDKSGNLIHTSNIIDLPLETMVVNGRYDSVTKEVVLTLDNGNEIRFSVADLVQGLVSTEQLASTLESYVQFTDYATTSKGGVIKLSNGKGTSISSGVLTAQDIAYSNYGNLNNNGFISKGTLENVITGKNLETANNKVTSVSASSTDIQYPSAKLFYDTQKAQNDDIDELQDNVFGDDTIDDEGEVIAFDSSAEHGIIDISKYGGNTEQFTTTGKNLLNPSNLVVFNSSQYLSTENYNTEGKIKLDTNTIYSLTYEATNSALADKKIFSYDSNNTKTQLTPTITSESGHTVVAFTTLNDTDKISFYVGGSTAYSSVQAFLNSYKLMLIKGNTFTAYEPYTGAKASPNPDYPQDIHIVSGDNILKIIGKNIFNKDEASYDGSGTVILDNYITVKNNCAYALSGNIVADNDNITLYYYDKNKKQLSTAQITNNNSDKFIFTTPINTRYLRFSLDTEVINFDTIQLELGNSVNEYEEYKENIQLISLGVENLFDINSTRTNNACTSSINVDKIIQKNTGTYARTNWQKSNLIIGQQYTLSCSYINNNNCTLRINIMDSTNNTQIVTSDSVNSTNGTLSVTFTASETTHYLRLYSNALNSSNNYEVTFLNIQFEKGSKANSYSPYGTTPIWLGKIGDYQDYIYKNNDNWYVHKDLNKSVLDGINNIFTISSTTNVNNKLRFGCSTINGVICNTTNGAMAYSDKLILDENAGTYKYVNGKNSFTIGSPDSVYQIDAISEMTVANANLWLKDNNITIYYPLEESTDTQITDPTLIYQLNTILYSYKGSTTINQDNNDAPFILTVNGFTDTTNGRINNLNAEILNAQALIGDINSILTTLDVGNGV